MQNKRIYISLILYIFAVTAFSSAYKFDDYLLASKNNIDKFIQEKTFGDYKETRLFYRWHFMDPGVEDTVFYIYEYEGLYNTLAVEKTTFNNSIENQIVTS